MQYVDYGTADEKQHIQPVSLDAVYYVMADNKNLVHHAVASYEWILIASLSGRGIIQTKGNKIQLNSGESLMLAPSQGGFQYQCMDNRWDFWWFEFRCFDSEFLNFPLEKPHAAQLNDKGFYLCEESLNSLKAKDTRTASCLFSSLLCMLSKECGVVTDTNSNLRLFRKAEHFILQNLTTVTVKNTAQHLNVSERTLLNLFQSMQGIRTVEYIQNKKIDEACRLLVFGDKSICEIAESLGYADQFAFSRAFCKRMGVCPSEYRKRKRILRCVV